jgi:uncharacterized protein DUF669
VAKVTFKIPKKAFEDAKDQGDFEQAPPGLYVAKLTSCEPHQAKTDGKPDPKKPSLECIYQIVGVGREGEKPDVRYSQIWDYVSMRDSEDVHWKQAQFAAAMGIGDGKKSVNVSKDPAEFVGTLVLLRVKKDKDQEGNYRAKAGWVGPNEGDEADAFDEADGAPDPDTDTDDTEAEAGDLYTEADLKAMDRDDFKALCAEYEIKTKGKKKSELVDLVLQAQEEAVAEEDGDEDGDGDDDDEPF